MNKGLLLTIGHTALWIYIIKTDPTNFRTMASISSDPLLSFWLLSLLYLNSMSVCRGHHQTRLDSAWHPPNIANRGHHGTHPIALCLTEWVPVLFCLMSNLWRLLRSRLCPFICFSVVSSLIIFIPWWIVANVQMFKKLIAI